MLNSRELHNLLPSFIENLVSSGASNSTIKNYASDLKTILEQLPEQVEIGQDSLTASLDSLKGKFSDSTLRRFGYSLKAFSIYLEKSGRNLPKTTTISLEPIADNVVAPVLISQTIAKDNINSPLEQYSAHMKSQGAAPSTTKLYTAAVASFFAWKGLNVLAGQAFSKQIIDKVSHKDIDRYVSFLRSRGTPESTVTNQLYSLKSFFNLHKEAIIYETNPVGNIKTKVASQGKKLAGILPLATLAGLKSFRKPRFWHAYRGHPMSDYINWAASASAVLIIGIMVFEGLFAPKPIDITNLKAQIQDGLVLAATPPRILSFQGRLTNPSGVPVTSATNIRFRIWDQLSGGTEGDCTGFDDDCFWLSKVWSVTPDSNGIFSVQLGDTNQSDTAIPAQLFADYAELYLGVTIGADAEATPRQRIAASSYALNSDTLDGIDSTAFLRSNENDSITDNAQITFTSGSQMITASGSTLDINGTLAWGGATVSEALAMNSQNITGIGTNLTAAGSLTIGTGSNNNINLSPNGSGDIIFATDNDTNIQASAQLTGTSSLDLIALTIDNQTSTGTQRGLVISNADNITGTTTETLISLLNVNTQGGVVTDGLLIGGGASFTDAIDVSHANIDNAINVGANNIIGTTAVIDFTNFDLSSAGVISAADLILGLNDTSATITTQDTNEDLIIDPNGSGTIFFHGATYGITSAGALTVASCSGCGGGGSTLQTAYDAGNTITTTSGNNIAFTLADVATPTMFSLTQSDPGGTSAFYLNNANASGTNTNGILIEQTGAGTLTNGLNITQTAGAITNGISLSGTFSTGIAMGSGQTIGICFDCNGNPTGLGGGINWGLSSPTQLYRSGASTLSFGTTQTLTSNSALTITPGSNANLIISPHGSGNFVLNLDDDTSLIANGTVTNTGFLFDLNLTLGNDSDVDIVSALNIDVTSANTGDADLLNAIRIGNLSSANATVVETALHIGTSWDYGLVSMTTKNGFGTDRPQELLQLKGTTSIDSAIQFEDNNYINAISNDPNNPSTTATNNDNGGVTNWTNPSNVASSDNAYATAAINSSEESYNLKATNFGFSIPTEASITGMRFEYEASSSTATSGYYLSLGRFVKSGGEVSSGFTGGIFLTSTDTYDSIGGSASTYGTSWTPADINDSNFGVEFYFSCEDFFGTCGPTSTARIDHVRITIYYTVNWTLGVDTSDGATFKLSRSTVLGTSDVITVNSSSVILGAQQDATAHTFTSTCSCILNSAAGTFGAQTNRDAVTASTVYRGKLFVAVSETDAAGIYRYDGGTTWTLVTNAVGKAVSGDSANIDNYVLTVWNDKLYIGSQTANNSGALYVSSTADTTANTFSLVQATRGTFGSGLTNIDGISALQVYNGSLYLGTQETNLAEVDRYDGGTTLTQVSNTTEGRIGTLASSTIDSVLLAVYDGRLFAAGLTGSDNAARVSVYVQVTTSWTDLTTTVGSFGSETGVNDVTGMTVYNGYLYISTGEPNAANIYRWDQPGTYSVNTTLSNWLKVNDSSGKIVTGDTANIDSIIIKTYNGRLYAGSQTAAGDDTGALYEYDGTRTSGWSLVNGTRGTFGAQTGVNAISTLQEFNGTLYVGTDEGTNNIGSVYTWSKTLGNSYMLRFDSGGSNFGGIGFQDYVNVGDGTDHHGSFFFTHSVALTSGAFDLAEDYPTFDHSLIAGEIVSIDPLAKEHVKRAQISDKKSSYLGIVSTNPGFKLSQKAELIGNDIYVPIALSGRVPLRVSSENGNIEPGDFLTLSSVAGVGMKAGPNSPTIGKALEGYESEDTSDITTIMVFVDLGYSFDGTINNEETTQPFTIDSENNINLVLVSGTKFIWKNSAGQVVAFVTDSGDALFNKITATFGNFTRLVFGEAVVKKDTKVAGEAVFEANSTEVFIESDKIAEDSLINLTPSTKTNGLSLYIKEKRTGEGFVVALERNSGDLPTEATASATQAIKFTWFILNQE